MTTRKPRETTEWINRFLIHPLSYKLVRLLIKTPVTPNNLSVFGLVNALLGAWMLYYAPQHSIYLILSALFFFFRMICDAADGQLARAKKICSEHGTLIDGICDYLSFFFIYSAVAYLYYPSYGSIIFLLILLTGLSNALQSSSYQLFLDLYNLVRYDQSGAKINMIRASKQTNQSWFLLVYNKLQLSFFKQPQINQLMTLTRSDKGFTKMQHLLSLWHLLALNYRYLLVVILIKHIEMFFYIEIIILNLMLLGLINRTQSLIPKDQKLYST